MSCCNSFPISVGGTPNAGSTNGGQLPAVGLSTYSASVAGGVVDSFDDAKSTESGDVSGSTVTFFRSKPFAWLLLALIILYAASKK